MMDIFFKKNIKPVSEACGSKKRSYKKEDYNGYGAPQGEYSSESCKTKKEACGAKSKNETCGTKKEACGTKSKKEACNGKSKKEDYDDYDDTVAVDEIKKKFELRKLKIAKKFKAKKDTKKAMVAECIYNIFDRSLGIQLESGKSYELMKRNLVESFVEEKGVDTLLENMKYTSIPLANMALLCEEYLDKIFEEVEGDETEFIINNKERDSFYDKLKSVGTDDISDLVKVRVMSAIEDFTQSNRNTKSDIEDTLKYAQTKIDNTDSEDVKESVTIHAKRKNTLTLDNRSKNIFECMVENIARSTINNYEMKCYTEAETGRLDMYKIVENAKVMYTFMETLNTAKLEKIDESYVRDVLNSLK